MAIEADTPEQTYNLMAPLLGNLMPNAEIRYKAEIVFKINELKKKRGAIILGHNYMEPALYHTVCDIVGDSLQLAREAQKTAADPIVFCGVRFMAETAKILNPTRTVLLPAKVAGCSLAASIRGPQVLALKAQYPGVPVVSYINCYSDVKAESDVICTSSNAVKIVDSLNSNAVIFLPDEYLGRNVAKDCGRAFILPGEAVPSSGPYLIGWKGRCEVHEQFTVEDIDNARAQFPDVVVLAHPECSPEVVAKSDYAASTTKMVNYVKNSKAKRFLILTECAMGDNIIAENPDRELLRLCSVRCPHMNEITLEDTLRALENNEQIITVEESIRVRALRALERMLAVG